MLKCTDNIINEPERVGFLNGLGHDLLWGNYEDSWGEATTEQWAEFNELFEYLGDGHHTNGDTYQGTTFVVLIRRKSDDQLFGADYWEGGGKHGERYVGEGHTSDDSLDKYDEENDWEPLEEWYFFLPVELKPLPAYKFRELSND